jgi:hypothetical protein
MINGSYDDKLKKTKLKTFLMAQPCPNINFMKFIGDYLFRPLINRNLNMST